MAEEVSAISPVDQDLTAEDSVLILEDELETLVLPGSQENSVLQEAEDEQGLDSIDNQTNDTVSDELKNMPENDGTPSDSTVQEDISRYQDAPPHDVALPLDIPPTEDQTVSSSQEETATNEVQATVYHSSTTVSSPSEGLISNLEDSTTENAAATKDSQEQAADLSIAKTTEVQPSEDDPIDPEIPFQETAPEDAPPTDFEYQGSIYDEDSLAAQEGAVVKDTEQPTVPAADEENGGPVHDMAKPDNTLAGTPSATEEQSALDGMTGESSPETTPTSSLVEQDSPEQPEAIAEIIKQVENQSFGTTSPTSASPNQEDSPTLIQDETEISREAQDPVPTMPPACPPGEWISLAPKPAATDDAKKDAESCFF